jgi:hypothetical protein
MAYAENTGINSPQDLIDAIATFCASNGWTVDRNDLVSTNRTLTMHIAGVSDYVHIFNINTTEVQTRLSVGYDGGLAPNLQPNVQPFSSRSNGLSGPFPRVYFFADGTEVHVVVESSIANEWRHLCFGVAQKIGAYDGGTYADGTWRGSTHLGDYPASNQHHVPFGMSGARSTDTDPYAGCIRADDAEGARTNFFHWFGDGGASATYGRAHTGVTSWSAVSSGGVGWLARLTGGADQNAFSARSVGQNITVLIDRTGSPLYRSPIANIRNTRFINIVKFNNADEFIIGSDTWKVFPAIKRSLQVSSASGAPNYGSHTMGFAVKKVA